MLDKKSMVALKRYLHTDIMGRWTESLHRWGDYVVATDGVGALAIRGTDDYPEAEERYMQMILRDTDPLPEIIRFHVDDIAAAMNPWPSVTQPNGKVVKIPDPRDNASLVGFIFGDIVATFSLVNVRRLCQTIKALGRTTIDFTHASEVYTRATCGDAHIVLMPYKPDTDEEIGRLVHPVVPMERGDAMIIGQYRVVMEDGVLVGYKRTAAGLDRVVTNTSDPERFKEFIKKPKAPKPAPPNVTQTSIFDLGA